MDRKMPKLAPKLIPKLLGKLNGVLASVIASVIAAVAPCTTGLVAWWSDTWADDATVTDLSTDSSHLAIPPVSVYLDGGSFGTLSTAITSVGDFEISVGLKLDLSPIFAYGAIIGTTITSDYLYVPPSLDRLIVGIDNVQYDFITNLSEVRSVIVSRTDTTLSMIINGVAQTPQVCTTADFTFDLVGWAGTTVNDKLNGNIWDLVIKDSTGSIVFSNYLASGASSTVSPSVVGPDVTWTGLTVPDDWTTDDPRFGHSWNKKPGYSLDVPDGVELWSDAGFSGTNWALSDGYWVHTPGSASSLADSIGIILAENYYTTIEVKNRTAGSVTIKAGFGGGLASGTVRSTNGTFTESITCGGNTVTYLSPSSDFNGSVKVIAYQFMPQGYIPAASEDEDETLDIYGNDLTHPGSALQNMTVKGFAGEFDGSAYATLESAITIEGYFNLSARLNNIPTDATYRILFEGVPTSQNFIFYRDSDTLVNVRIANVDRAFTIEITNYISIVRDASGLTVSNGVTSQTLTDPGGDFSFNRIGSAANIWSGGVWDVVLIDADATINHWPIQSSNTTTQGTIYDVVGGNHATLTGHTTPFFTGEIDESWLAQWGGSEVENLLTYSEDFTNGSLWVVGSGDVTANQAIAPDGSLTADLINGTALVSAVGSVSDGQTKSIYARTVSGTGTTALGGYNGAGTKYHVSLTESWQRFDFPSDTGEVGGDKFYAVDFRYGTLTEVLLWGAQLETGSVVSEYIKTEGSAIPLSIIPGKEDSTEDAAGNTKTFTKPYSDSPESAFIWNAPLTAEVWAADNDVVLPEELVDDADDTTWAVLGSNTVVTIAGETAISYVDNTNGGSSYFRESKMLSADLVVGQSYRYSGKWKINSGETATLYLYASAVIDSQVINSTEYVDVEFDFIATSATSNYIGVNPMSVGCVATFKDVSVKQIGKQLIADDGSAAKDFDPYDFVEPDLATFLMGPDGAVLLEDEQTGDCLDQTIDAIGGL